jgi:hypothetical protein
MSAINTPNGKHQTPSHVVSNIRQLKCCCNVYVRAPNFIVVKYTRFVIWVPRRRKPKFVEKTIQRIYTDKQLNHIVFCWVFRVSVVDLRQIFLEVLQSTHIEGHGSQFLTSLILWVVEKIVLVGLLHHPGGVVQGLSSFPWSVTFDREKMCAFVNEWVFTLELSSCCSEPIKSID